MQSLVMIYVQTVYPFFYPGGDSATDFFMARYILHLPGGLYISSHGPGMPIFLILSGVLPFGTWWIMIGLYAAMSVAIPCLIYGMIRPYSRLWAMIATVVVITGGVSYGYSRYDTYDQLFLFLEFLNFFLVTLYYRDAGKYKRFPYLIAAFMFIATLVKAIAALLFWIFLVSAFFVPKVNRRNLLGSAVCFVILMGFWGALDRSFGNVMCQHFPGQIFN